jgi:hypothetical protein
LSVYGAIPGGYVARSDRRRSRQWRFSDSGSRFDRKRQGSTVDRNPISSAFPRKVIHCRRCGTRIVSNVSHCPFCGKSVQPFFRKLWFWLIIVVLLLGGFAALFLWDPLTQEPEPIESPQPPFVIGAAEGTPYKDLAVGTTIDFNNLLVTVTSVSNGLTSSDGRPISAVEVQFINKGEQAVTLYSTQWMMEGAFGSRVEGFIGKTDAGETIAAAEASDLAAGEQRITTFYFCPVNDEALEKVVFLTDALSYQEDDLVTWRVAGSVS